MPKRIKEQYARIVERQDRKNTAKKFKNAQQGNQDLRKYINSNWSPKVRGICDRIIDIVQRLTQPRPEPGNRKKRELDENNNPIVIPENNPDWSLDQESEELRKRPDLKPMVKQLQQQIHELSEVERSNIAAFGASLPGSIRNVVQGFVGNSIVISYDPRGPVDQTLATGPHRIDSSLGIEQNAEKRSLQEGGVPTEVEEADQEEGLFSNPNPYKMEPTPP
ncbi:MAG: hypothetical protein PVG30_03625 [Gammaproteobacteria bacterium]